MVPKSLSPQVKPVADKKPEEEEEIDIDLNDPDVAKAAVKIQSSFKNLMSKKKKTQSGTSQ